MGINVLYGQSGGPTSVINATFYGVIRQCQREESIDKLYFMHNGIKGLLKEDIKDISEVREEQIELLPFTPGAICGSARYKLKDFTVDDSEYKAILEIVKKYNIGILLYNGGNDSMDTCNKIAKYFAHIGYKDCKVIGVPKTIDNDLAYTDHTPGYGSAAKFIANSIATFTCDNSTYEKGRVNVIEIMGRDAGWLTAASALASVNGVGPDLIYVPETNFSFEKFLKDVKRIYDEKQRVTVAVSEGIHDKDGNLIYTQGEADAFNHSQLGGVCRVLASHVEKELNLPCRAIELSLLQRCFSPCIAAIDGKEAIECGARAVKFALEGCTDHMVTIERISTVPYKATISSIPLSKVANEVKYLPKEFINDDENGITDKFVEYILPIIGGKTFAPHNDGLCLIANKKYFD